MESSVETRDVEVGGGAPQQLGLVGGKRAHVGGVRSTVAADTPRQAAQAVGVRRGGELREHLAVLGKQTDVEPVPIQIQSSVRHEDGPPRARSLDDKPEPVTGEALLHRIPNQQSSAASGRPRRPLVGADYADRVGTCSSSWTVSAIATVRSTAVDAAIPTISVSGAVATARIASATTPMHAA